MKKLLSTLIIVALVFSTFTGCLSVNTPSESNAVETVENFLTALTQLDGVTMNSYLFDESMVDSIPFSSSKSFTEHILSNLPAELEEHKNDFIPVIDAMDEKITSCMSYEILSVEANGDSYDVFAEYIMPANLDTIVDIYAKTFSRENREMICKNLMNIGAVTDSTTEEELKLLVTDEIINQAIEIADETEFEAKEKQIVYTVSEFGGKWLIVLAK